MLLTPSERGLTGYDESRKVVKKPRGEGEAWSELKRPGQAHLNWEGFDFDVWHEEIKAPEDSDERVLWREGGMDQRWQKPVLGEPLEDSLGPHPQEPSTRWNELELNQYHQDLADPKHVQDVSRSRFDPGWQEGMITAWEQVEPGPGKMGKIADIPPDMNWKERLGTWKTTVIEEKDRPLQNL